MRATLRILGVDFAVAFDSAEGGKGSIKNIQIRLLIEYVLGALQHAYYSLKPLAN